MSPIENPLPPATKEPNCFTDAELDKLAKALTDLRDCRIEINEKDLLIQQRLTMPDPIIAGTLWWQTPEFVVGGVVVSGLVGLLFGAYVVGHQ